MTTGTKIGYALLGLVIGIVLTILVARTDCGVEGPMCPNTTQAEFIETGECY